SPCLRAGPDRREAALPYTALTHIHRPLSFFVARAANIAARHRAQPRLDADRREVVGDGLAGREIGRPRIKVATLEAVRVAGLGQQLFGLRGIVGMGLERQRKLEAGRHDIAGWRGGADRLRLAQPLAVDGKADRWSAHGDFGSHMSRKSMK